jgi:L-rhamnose mutarotase
MKEDGKMVRFAWKAYVDDLEEYKRRHDEIWPEMTDMLNEAGIHNYTIWNVGDELFAYMECDIDLEESMRIQSQSDVGKRWAQHMKGILRYDENTGGPIILEQVFYHK